MRDLELKLKNVYRILKSGYAGMNLYSQNSKN
ncbi:unnamed protein product [Onchocerca flexuosa]|uniref:Transposase n=1 Tax=Onchocerca flexuosa TaxID=387005 RepID=A0A183HPJ2_9BILA|nr:unnamed protein product [Onchocerca flexuosa]